MESIQTVAIQTYQKNLEYFSKHHPSIMQKLADFDNAVESKTVSIKYDLEYVKNYFDVKELKSNHYLYTKDSNSISKELQMLINYKKSSYSFEGYPLYYNQENNQENSNDKVEGRDGLFKIMTYYIDNSKSSDEMKSIEKFIFIGTGLGLHLPLIDEKINAQEYLIIEDDLELFKLSLFVTPYFTLGENKTLHFSIADNENSFVPKIKSFLENSFFNNRYLKYSYFPAHSDVKIKQIQNALTSQSFVTFPYNISLKKFLKPLDFINSGYHIVNLQTHLKDSAFSTKPVLLLGAGPSLEKNIDWLKENHQKFIIIAVSATLNFLYENNITPDIVTHLDGFSVSVDHYKNFPAQEFLKNALFLFGPFTPSALRDIFNKKHIFYYEESTYYFKGFNSIGSYCVGSASLLHALILDSHELYVLGLDLALNQETGDTHSSSHIFAAKNDLNEKDTLKSTMSLRSNIFSVKGNFRPLVLTTSLFQISVQTLHDKIPHIKREYQTIYNLSDGAYINQSIPTYAQDIDISSYKNIDKKELLNDIYKTLSTHSLTDLSQDDLISLKKRLSYAKEIKEYLISYKNSVSHANADRYLYDFLGIVSSIYKRSGREEDNLLLVYSSFFNYALSLVVDLLNTKGLKNTKRHIKKLDLMIQEEMFNIQNIYETSLEKFIEEKCHTTLE